MIRYTICLLSYPRLNLVYFNVKIVLIIYKKEGILIKNKYEDIDMVNVFDDEDIYDIFIEHASNPELDETIGLIANRELVNYITDGLLDLEWTSAKKIDFEQEDLEYMVSIDNDGYVVAIPVEYYKDKYFVDMKTVYISMGGDITQGTIDECVNADKEVILFGLSEDDCECGDCCDCCDCKFDDSITTKSNSSTVIRGKDGKLNGFSSTWSDNTDDIFYNSSYSYYSNNEESIKKLAKEFGVNID